MTPRAVVVTALLVATSLLALHAAAPQVGVPVTLRVSHPGAPLSPGDVAWFAVTPSSPVEAVEGEAFGRRVPFWRAAGGGTWQALLAVGLETKPGSYDVRVRASAAAGASPVQSVRLQVKAKTFETRQLRVSSQFVDPPADEVERIEREARTTAAIYARTGTERLWDGPFVMPGPGRPTSSFGRLSVYNGQPRGRHQGADFAAATGTPVRAPNAGRVALAADLFMSGNTIILDHGTGLFSVFAHLSRMMVGVDALVATGDLLGEAGATGRVTGPHLHWAVRLGAVSVDPLSLMSAAAALSGADSGPAR